MNTTRGMVWRVEIISDTCGCTIPYHKVAVVDVDPQSGDVIRIKTWERIELEEYAKLSLLERYEPGLP